MASPLVVGVIGGTGGAGYAEAGEGVSLGDNLVPHWGQNEGLPSGIWNPQEVQAGMWSPRIRQRLPRTVHQSSNKSILKSEQIAPRSYSIRTFFEGDSLSNVAETPTMQAWQIPTS